MLSAGITAKFEDRRPKFEEKTETFCSSSNFGLRSSFFAFLLVVYFSSSAALADSIVTKTQTISDCKIMRVVGGRVIARVGDDAKSFPLADIERVEITGLSKLTDAEEARAQKDWPRANALYVEAGRSTSKAVQMLTQARLIRVLDERGQWSDAVKTFLKIYATEPGDAAWSLRPANLPVESSVMLPESARQIEAAMQLPALQTVPAQRHMKQLLVDIYLQMNDARAAKLAHQLQEGVDSGPAASTSAAKPVESPAATSAPAEKTTGVDAAIKQAEELLAQKKYPEALAALDAAADKADGAAAAQLAVLRGDALAAAGQNDDALMAYIRVPGMADSGTWGGAALLKAADLQKKLGRDEAAARLYREVMDKYPDTLWAKEAEKKK